MAEKTGKIIRFPYDVMTITIPLSEPVFVEVKEIPEKIESKGVTALTSIGFFKCIDGEIKHVKLSQPATLKVKRDRPRPGRKELVWWNGEKWVPFESQYDDVDKDYRIAETTGWTEDPSIGWR